ncbi:Putative short-chain dehydrogenase/reductase SDR, NAD(P)-binding domain superfamily [Colletotrichum destructivum]|uniref:Short-chain dehydrogenase/reductase SDR, NAD(P)-binding domain superfamily n=1 Tax=Colletotrichum destructivum TaxID=34406 RepID=A0AAX4IWP8_9PEZI|nr:Putative short-chain dehydrogenase/reductase SDR, NAD(P)-binding domain superfamily [Colletotrichum destructivum]
MAPESLQAPAGPPRKVDAFTGDLIHHDTYPDIDPVTVSDCKGKAVLVTGASKGLGKAIAIGYAEAGASMIAVAARSDVSSTVSDVLQAAEKAGRAEPTVLALEMDVSSTPSVKAAAKRLTAEWGRLDILINNAGYMAPFQLLLETDEDEYMKAWDVNYWGTYRVTKAFLPLMLKGGDKTIVNMSSVAAHFMGAGGGAYHISKFALIRFTEFVQDEYADQGVLAFSIHPGGVPTELSSNLPEKLQFRMRDTPELAAHSVAYLTSTKRDWLGGRWLSCMWDMPTLMSMEKRVVDGNLLKFECSGL